MYLMLGMHKKLSEGRFINDIYHKNQAVQTCDLNRIFMLCRFKKQKININDHTALNA